MKKTNLPPTIRLFPAGLLLVWLGLAACGRPKAPAVATPTPTPTPTPSVLALNRGQADESDESLNGPETSLSPTTPTTPVQGACLLGTWEVDNASQLALLQTTTQGSALAGDFTDVRGVLRITFDDVGMITNSSEGFEYTICGPEGCLTLPYSYSGTSSYRVEDDLLVVAGGQFVSASIGGITGQAETTENRASYSCSASTLVLEMEGFPPQRWTRVVE